ncbi:MAG: DNRLRE domain-containing protein, partial [Acutalibacteraceae bacterium]
IDPTIKHFRVRYLNEACYGSFTAPEGSDSTKEWFIQNYDTNYSELCYFLPSDNFTISQNVVVTSAKLSVYCQDTGDSTANSNTIAARAITESWAESTESTLSKSSDILDYNTIPIGSVAGRYYWDVTEAVAMWALGQNDNYGIALCPYTDNRCNVKVYKGENVYTAWMPWLEIDYERTDSNRDKFNYESIDMGRAGTVNINTHNGTLYLERNDLSLSGNLLPVSTGVVYNPWSAWDYNTNSMGAYWHNTYFLRLLNGGTVSETVTDDETNTSQTLTRRVLKLLESDTLIKEYRETSETDSNGLVKYVCISGESDYTLYADSSLNTTLDYSKVTVVDNNSGNKLYFTSNGKLNRIIDEYSNQNTVEYIGEGNHTISNITDGAGRQYVYTSASLGGYSKIGTLKAVNAAGNTIQMGGEDFKITYSYTKTGADSVANLTSITYPDGESIKYEYDSNCYLTAVEGIDGARLEITYVNGRVSGYRRYVGEHKLESGMDIQYDSALQRTYSYYQAGSTQPSSIETVRYDSGLREISRVTNDGDFSFSNYDAEGNLTSDAYTKDSSASELIINGDFATSASWSYAPIGSGSVINSEAMGRRTTTNAECFKLNGAYNSNARVCQTVSNLTVGDIYTFGAWAKGTASAGSSKTFGILIEDSDNNIIGSYEFNKNYDGWQFGAASFKATTASVTVYLIYDNQTSPAYFDGVTMFKSDIAQVNTSNSESDESSDTDDENIPDEPVPATGYNAQPCSACSCAQCTTAYYDASGNWLGYYQCHCSEEDEQHNNCGCLGCRQERGKNETKDSYGNVIKSEISSTMYTTNSYTSSGNYLASSTDEFGTVVYYNYNADTGLLESTGKTSNESYHTSYEYNAMG